ncbi:hypothetical protein M404DRAFT_149873, partial [Pisolithus tinctorius Marx 270]
QGGGARYPYPKQVWSPAGGWWSRPASWKTNTAITFAGILAVAYGVWTVSAEREASFVCGPFDSLGCVVNARVLLF